MRKSLLVFLIFSFLSTNLFADWFEINVYDKVIPFGKVAHQGKVSIFILSTPWCGPCQILKKALREQGYNMEAVDIYYVNMAPKNSGFKELKRKKSYYVWRNIEGLEMWPTVYILNQSTNIKAIFTDKGKDRDLVSRVNRIVNNLISKNKYFSTELLYTTTKNNINTDKEVLFPKRESLQKELKFHKVKIDQLKITNDSLKAQLFRLKDNTEQLKTYRERVRRIASEQYLYRDTINSVVKKNNELEVINKEISQRLKFIQNTTVHIENLDFFERKKDSSLHKTNRIIKSTVVDLELFLESESELEKWKRFRVQFKNRKKKVFLSRIIEMSSGINKIRFSINKKNFKYKTFQIEVIKDDFVFLKKSFIF